MNLKKIISSFVFKKVLKENIENDIHKWMSGECIPFTVALNDIFPNYRIAVLNDEFEVDDEDVECNYNFVHAFCYLPNNEKIIIDARGVRKLKDLYDEFHDINPVIDWDIPNSQFLIDNFAGKEFYSEESFEYDVSEYIEAKDWIEKNKNIYQAD